MIDVGSDALLEIGWRGTDELRLLEGVQLYGFGNWMDIAEHVGGGRSREAVERHYRRCYLESPHFPTPHFEGLEGGGAAEGEGGAADGSAAKRRRTDSDAVPAAPPPDTAAGADSGGADGAGSSGGVPGPDPSEVGPRPPEEEFRCARVACLPLSRARLSLSLSLSPSPSLSLPLPLPLSGRA